MHWERKVRQWTGHNLWNQEVEARKAKVRRDWPAPEAIAEIKSFSHMKVTQFSQQETILQNL